MSPAPIDSLSTPSIDPGMIDEARRTGYNPSAAMREPKQEMDSEMFMSLLVTQLTNQDPSSPMDTNEMVGQTTQLAAMEQLTTMATAQKDLLELQYQLLATDQRSAASNMIGQVVTTDGSEGEPVTGVATAVTFSPDGEPMVAIDGDPHPLSTIAAVAALDADED